MRGRKSTSIDARQRNWIIICSPHCTCRSIIVKKSNFFLFVRDIFQLLCEKMKGVFFFHSFAPAELHVLSIFARNPTKFPRNPLKCALMGGFNYFFDIFSCFQCILTLKINFFHSADRLECCEVGRRLKIGERILPSESGKVFVGAH